MLNYASSCMYRCECQSLPSTHSAIVILVTNPTHLGFYTRYQMVTAVNLTNFLNTTLNSRRQALALVRFYTSSSQQQQPPPA